MGSDEYCDRVTVTAVVARAVVPRLCAQFHQLLGLGLRRRYHEVLLPADTRSFGLVAGGAGTPAQGVIENLPKRALRVEQVPGGELWAVPMHSLGTYFGWSDPSGVRIQFHTQTGESYAVTITYDVLPGHDERKFQPLIDALLATGTNSLAMSLTEVAARRWRPIEVPLLGLLRNIAEYLGFVTARYRVDAVQLVDPEPKERIVRES